MAGGTALELCYVRGDTSKKSFRVTADKVAVDLTGVTGIIITVTEEKTSTSSVPAPTIVTQFDGSLSGTPTDGFVFFQPQGADETARQAESDAYIPGKYNYSVRWVNVAGSEETPFPQGAFKMLEAKTTT